MLDWNHWDFVNSIGQKKGHSDASEEDFKDNKEYKQRNINLHFSQFANSINLANEANQMQGLTNKQHYDFLYNTIAKADRFFRKDKVEKEYSEDDFKALCTACGCTPRKMRHIMKVLTEEQIEHIIKKLDKGG